jgi:hypothetical protein
MRHKLSAKKTHTVSWTSLPVCCEVVILISYAAYAPTPRSRSFPITSPLALSTWKRTGKRSWCATSRSKAGIRRMFYELLPPITSSVISSIGYASIASQVCAPAPDPRRLNTRPDPRLNAIHAWMRDAANRRRLSTQPRRQFCTSILSSSCHDLPDSNLQFSKW